jgi:dihydroxy-acid dehydratase
MQRWLIVVVQEAKGWHPAEERKRKVSKSLKIYAMHSTSAAKGAVRVNLIAA